MPRRSICLLLPLVLLVSIFFVPSAGAAKAGPGSIRVLLSAYSEQNQMSLGIYGSYLINDTLMLQRGAKVRITCDQQHIRLYYEGAVFQMGESVRLIRHAAPQAEENGLRIGEELNLYEGDLHIRVQDGRLWPVLHIGIEDYLLGVVPHEMADSFPLEALKAQAIAARTYGLRGLRTDRDFDVYDSTLDQVYRGFNPDNTRAHEAVRGTAGIALVYGQELAQCLYTASNGGQTESAANAWGREAISYLLVKEDPYDAENPLSITRRYRVPRMGERLDASLKALLTNTLLPKMQTLGYDSSPDYVQILEVASVVADSPRFGEGSRLMTRLHFDLWVQGRRRAVSAEEEVALFSQASPPPEQTTDSPWGPMMRLPEPVRLSFNFYPELERLLDLSINIRENEVLDVLEEPDSFVIRTGRYGHGVGMSQRGAEWMASHYNKSYRDILAFYYPGTAEKTYATVPAARMPISQDFLTTPGPRPTSTPRPTLVPLSQTPAPGQRVVYVRGISRNSSLNLRETPNLSAGIVQQLYYDQALLVLEDLPDGWLKVQADGLLGYVMASYTQSDP